MLKKYIAGLILKPLEVKFIKNKKNLFIKNSYIVNKNKELFIKNIIIYNTNREIKILLKKIEIKDIINKLKKKNYLILILNIFIKKYIKTTIVLSLIKNKKYEVEKNT